MFIKKERHEAVLRRNEELESRVMELENRLQEREEDKHIANGLCEGCRNLVQTSNRYFPASGLHVGEYDCALNRKCKDYSDHILSASAEQMLIEAHENGKKRLREFKAEARKTFAERLKEFIEEQEENFTYCEDCGRYALTDEDIDKVLQEMEAEESV